jgi:hypothetical protein
MPTTADCRSTYSTSSLNIDYDHILRHRRCQNGITELHETRNYNYASISYTKTLHPASVDISGTYTQALSRNIRLQQSFDQRRISRAKLRWKQHEETRTLARNSSSAFIITMNTVVSSEIMFASRSFSSTTNPHHYVQSYPRRLIPYPRSNRRMGIYIYSAFASHGTECG